MLSSIGDWSHVTLTACDAYEIKLPEQTVLSPLIRSVGWHRNLTHGLRRSFVIAAT